MTKYSIPKYFKKFSSLCYLSYYKHEILDNINIERQIHYYHQITKTFHSCQWDIENAFDKTYAFVFCPLYHGWSKVILLNNIMLKYW